jgi:hypothetical protein
VEQVLLPKAKTRGWFVARLRLGFQEIYASPQQSWRRSGFQPAHFQPQLSQGI